MLERVAWANAISCAVAFFVAFFALLFEKPKFGSPLPLAKDLFRSSLPITAVRIFNSLIVSAVAVLLPAMLVKSGISNTDAVKLYGVLTGMVVPVLFIPATLIGTLSLVLSPQLSEDFYKKNYAKLKNTIERGLTVSTFLSLLLAPLIFVLAEEIGGLFFSSATAGEMLKTGAPILLPISLSMLSTSVMNSLGNQKTSLKHYLFGALSLATSILVFTPLLKGYSYLLGMGLNFSVNALCNLLFLWRNKLLDGRFFKKLFLFFALFLPVSLFGQLIKSVCVATLGPYFAFGFIAFETLGFAVVIGYFASKSAFKRKKA